MKAIGLIGNEWSLFYFELKQYWLETVTSMVIMTLIFGGLFFGIKSFVGLDQADSFEGLIFGYILWTYATTAYNSVSGSMVEDNQKGLIEQLFLAPSGLISIMLSRSVVQLIWGCCTTLLLAVFAMIITQTWLDINFVELYLVLLLGTPALLGLGLIVSGLAIVYKKVISISAVITLGIIGLVSVPALPLSPLSALPFSPAADLARRICLEGHSLSFEHILIVVINSAVYFLIGLLAYFSLEKKAKKLNIIGQY